MKVMTKNVYIREPVSVKLPEYWIFLKLEYNISYQTTADDQGSRNYPTFFLLLLSHKNTVARYDCLPIRGTQYLASGLGIEKGKRPDHVWSCVSPHARTKFIGLEPLMV